MRNRFLSTLTVTLMAMSGAMNVYDSRGAEMLASGPPVERSVALQVNVAILAAFDDSDPKKGIKGHVHATNRNSAQIANALHAAGWEVHLSLTANGASNRKAFERMGFDPNFWPGANYLELNPGIVRSTQSRNKVRTFVLEQLDFLISRPLAPEKLILYLNSHGSAPLSLKNPVGHGFGSSTINESEQASLYAKVKTLRGRGSRVLIIDDSCYSGSLTVSQLAKVACVLGVQSSRTFSYTSATLPTANFILSKKLEKLSVIDLYGEMLNQYGVQPVTFDLKIKGGRIPELPILSGVNLTDADKAYWLLTYRHSTFSADKAPIKDEEFELLSEAFRSLQRIEKSLGKEITFSLLLKEKNTSRLQSILQNLRTYKRAHQREGELAELMKSRYTKIPEILISERVALELADKFLSTLGYDNPSVDFGLSDRKSLAVAIIEAYDLTGDYQKNSVFKISYPAAGVGAEEPELSPKQLVERFSFPNSLKSQKSVVLRDLSLSKNKAINKHGASSKWIAAFSAVSKSMAESEKLSKISQWRHDNFRLIENNDKIEAVKNFKLETLTPDDLNLLEDVMTYSLRRVLDTESKVRKDPRGKWQFENCVDFTF